jgi:TolA-binding protein
MPKKGKITDPATTSDADMDSTYLSSENVLVMIEKITSNFTLTFNTCIDRIVEAVEKRLSQRIDCQASEIFDLNKKIETLEKNSKQLEITNKQLTEKNNQLHARIETLATNVDDLDQYSRNSNLLIHGIPLTSPPGTSEGNLIQHTVQLLNNHLGTTLQEADINAAHRTGRTTNFNTGPNETHAQTNMAVASRPQPIILQFVSKKLRHSTLSLQKHLKGKGISITEQLTVRKASLLKKCSELVSSKKLEGAWSHEGKILIKTLNHRTIIQYNVFFDMSEGRQL